MTVKLVRNSMVVAISVMVLSIGLFLGMLYQYFTDRLMDELKTEVTLATDREPYHLGG